DFLLPGLLLEFPAHRWRTRETQQLEAWVGGEEFGALPMTGQNGKGAPRQVCLRQYLTDEQRSDRRLACRLEHEGAANRQRRRNLVSSQVEWKVEGRNEGTRSDWHALVHTEVAAGPG